MVTDLDHPLLKFSDDVRDFWTLRDAVRGVQIFGGIGSGKSSGSGQALALSYLKSGFGGIVLTGKVDETELWLKYADQTGRRKDVIVFGPGSNFHFNPLDYEMKRPGEGAGETDNIVDLFVSIMQMGGRAGSARGQGDSGDPFWQLAMQRCMKAAVDVLKLAGQSISVANITKVISEAPLGGDHLNNFQALIASEEVEDRDLLHEWAQKSYTIYCLAWASMRDMTGAEQLAYDVVLNYFLADFSRLADNTRTSITEQFYAFANPFRSGLLATYFATDTSSEILPETTFDGKIVILDFPVKKYLQLGVYAQAIYKRIWQQAVERRDTKRYERPVFMWLDEAQYFLNENDMLFQTTARSSLACSVMISQNISNYYATIGGSNTKERVDSLLGNLATKIFHSNNDYVTNEWAANTIGKTYQDQTSYSIGDTENTSVSRALQYQVEPQEFTLLRGGSVINNYLVDAITTVAGKTWSTGENFLRAPFNQRIY